ncbi:MAG: hypothetical protein EBS51_14580 [Planctomycetia bacterium]|nr:hypothetical protein [Planctomycetia bacterium]
MSHSRCPVCQGETFEIRAKLVCRRCGMILETCCEGGPMGCSPAAEPEPAPSADPEQPRDSRRG